MPPLPLANILTHRRLIWVVALTLVSLVTLTLTVGPTGTSSTSPTSTTTTPSADWDTAEVDILDVTKSPAGEEDQAVPAPGVGELGGELYREFESRSWEDRQSERARFREVDILGDECLESWLGHGIPCPSPLLPSAPPPFDVLWTWGNGSDPLWKPLYDHFLSLTPTAPEPPAARHYRATKDELRHSLRSVMANMEPRPRRMHLVLGDWEVEGEEGGGGRLGQMPGWLDWRKGVDERGRVLGLEEVGEGETEVFVHHHSEIFLKGTGGEEEQRNHTRDSTPTYNSFAIESNLHSLPNMSPVVLYMQDDFFLLKKHTIADFVTPFFGPVLRLSSPKSYQIPAFRYPAPGCEHEWSSLLRSAWLLGERFAKKKRGYLIHVAKALSHPLLLETNSIWSSDFDLSSTRRFRETSLPNVATGDLNTSWLSTWLHVERARESTLWVWVVARMGGADGMWGSQERREVRRMLGMRDVAETEVEAGEESGVERREKGAEEVVEVGQERRQTTDQERLNQIWSEAGVEGPTASRYYWSSLDGPLPGLGGRRKASCTLKLTTCFGPWWEDESATISADDMFKRLAFSDDGSCGDCLFTALIAASGPLGLSAILPPPLTPSYTLPSDQPSNPTRTSYTSQQAQDLQPHMPLTPFWSSTNFSLPAMIGQTNPSDPTAEIDLRKWSLRLIARYQWVSADSKALFYMIQAPSDFGNLVENVEKDPFLVSLATNDDILEKWDELLSPMVRAWYGAKWAIKGWWEREGR